MELVCNIAYIGPIPPLIVADTLELSMALVRRSWSQCLNHVIQVSNSHPREAEQHLVAIKKSTPFLLEQIKKQQAELTKKRDKLDSEDKSLKRKIGTKEEAKNAVSANIRRLNQSKCRNEALLEDERRTLYEAERKKREAESKKDDAVVGTVAGGVAAGILGVIFPPSLIVTVPAVATAGAISITDAVKAIDRCKERISDIERSIDREKQEIINANCTIDNLQKEISELNAAQTALYEELGQIRETFVFLQNAVTYFSEIHDAVTTAGKQKTDLLHKIIEKACKKKQYRILNSRGGQIVFNSFVDAWEYVEKMMLSGNEAGYLGISAADEQDKLTS